jgi:hypothetical protein
LPIWRDWLGGLVVVDPTKLRDDGEAVMDGLDTVRVTVMVVDGFIAPGATTVMWPT